MMVTPFCLAARGVVPGGSGSEKDIVGTVAVEIADQERRLCLVLGKAEQGGPQGRILGAENVAVLHGRVKRIPDGFGISLLLGLKEYVVVNPGKTTGVAAFVDGILKGAWVPPEKGLGDFQKCVPADGGRQNASPRAEFWAVLNRKE